MRHFKTVAAAAASIVLLTALHYFIFMTFLVAHPKEFGKARNLRLSDMKGSRKEDPVHNSQEADGLLYSAIPQHVATQDSRNMTVEERAKFQQSQVDKFCQQYEKRLGKNYERLNKHLLINNKTDVAFCYVAKTGCSTLKVLFFLTMDAIPKERFANWVRDPSDEAILLKAIKANSFGAKSKTEQDKILRAYEKIMMYRNPASRLVSGYFSKVDSFPLIGTEKNKPGYNWLRMAIYNATHPVEFAAWMKNGSRTPIHIQFEDYIKFWIDTKGIQWDEHFRTSIMVCSPCKVRYNYYGKFEDFASESAIFSDIIRGNRSHIYDKVKPKARVRVASEAPEYYKLISKEQKMAIVDLLAMDLGLYYALFPEERGSHKTIMGLDYDKGIPMI